MSFRSYATYKNSGVEWLGNVPDHWYVAGIKRGFQIVGGSTPKSDQEEYWDGDIPWVTPADLSRLTSRYVGETLRTLTPAGLASCSSTLVPPGSVILSTRAPIGSLGITEREACTNQGCKALVAGVGSNPQYIAYTLSVATEQLNVRGKGTTFLELSADELGDFAVPFPPPPEQVAIAAFLDRETAKIDALVEAQRRLIELLKEKRQAVISHAVTKGLDPTAPRKDSGVEWLGEVPAHWQVVALKRIISMKSGESITSDQIEDAGAYPVFGGNGLRGFAETYTHDGDYALVGRQGALCGNVNYAHGRFWASEHAVVATPRQATSVIWLGELLRTMNLNQYSVSAAQPGLSVEAIGNLKAPWPGLKEQQAISEYVIAKLDSIDALVTAANAGIVLLQERRSALISAAITGKIDVRGSMPPTAEAA